jgi:ATP-dependent RNA helicase HelY
VSARADFEARLGFQLDDFQRRALDALDAGRSVLVAAPTGSGKTLVAEYAIERSRAHGGKAFYTTPLKALSNQKYGDLVRAYGKDQVGLLTGDNSINGEAPVVVMTTEVLRNMIYAASPTLDDLHVVVLDEVHYLQERDQRAPRTRGRARLPLRDRVERRGGRGVDRDRARRDDAGDRGAPSGPAAAPVPRRRTRRRCAPPAADVRRRG